MPEILKTHHISAAVIDIIEQTKVQCFLVSPYVQEWPLLSRALDIAAEKKTKVTQIIRNDAKNLSKIEADARRRGFELVVLPRLHTKLYLNERTAVVSSMNLYDSSNHQNYEVAVRWRDDFAAKLRREIIEGDLLRLAPHSRIPGWFEEERQNSLRVRTEFEGQLSTRGFCVVCGTKMELDTAKIVVRCKPCWSRSPDALPRLRISFCHYCGQSFEGQLGEPMHHQCSTEITQHTVRK